MAWDIKSFIIMGTIFALVYAYKSYSKKQTPSLTIAVNLLFSMAGIGIGLKLIYLILFKKLDPVLEQEVFSIFIGGFAIIWVSFYSAIESFKK